MTTSSGLAAPAVHPPPTLDRMVTTLMVSDTTSTPSQTVTTINTPGSSLDYYLVGRLGQLNSHFGMITYEVTVFGSYRPPPTHHVSGRYCIHFYLFDYGRQMGQFSVNIEGPRLVPQVVKRWSGSQKKAWINVGITLTSPAEWKLVLESHVGSGTHSDIALDDLQVYAGSCVF
ncbi:metalloendopeptidase [Elysia marginata]|uniref:Metalloendopeptidase n=1 Tax=Elysia marginata TaxID=1093978 RepID=A0AAV4GED0_9GAST|nr:metalloendopeptidase [Elysia marginata]